MPPARCSTPFGLSALLASSFVACAPELPPQPVCPVMVSPAPPAPVATPASVPPSDPYLRVRVQPHSDPTKVVHVDLELLAAAPVQSFRLLTGAPDLLAHLTLADAGGPIECSLKADGDGVVLTPARPPVGVTRLAYDVTANTESPWKPLAERVLDDRFIGSGEGLLLLPDALDDLSLPIELIVDGAFLRAPNAASSWGVGATRRTRGRPRSLRHATFLVGAMGAAELDASDGHDEAVWLGYTAFDARPVAAEIAVTRSAMAELFKAAESPRGTVLFVTQPRPLGAYTTTPRSGGLLVQVGPSEPWSAALRVSVAQQVVRPWLGGELWVGPHDEARAAESYWFTEGVTRFFVTRLLARTGVLRPDDVRDAVVGESAAVVASPHRGKGNAALAALARTDETARAHLVARGALYAARVNALVREKSKGGWSLDTILLELLAEARKAQGPLPASSWVEAVVRSLGEKEREAFERIIDKGDDIALPANVLGHCYSAATASLTAFDLGFDASATRETKGGPVVGLAPKGPAARAGLRAGDVVEADYRDGHVEVPVKLVVKRGAETLHLTYKAAGVTRTGPVWTRVPGTPDEACSDAW